VELKQAGPVELTLSGFVLVESPEQAQMQIYSGAARGGSRAGAQFCLYDDLAPMDEDTFFFFTGETVLGEPSQTDARCQM
jgi:hypothetical protein